MSLKEKFFIIHGNLNEEVFVDDFGVSLIRNSIHYSMHFLVPGIIAYFFYKAKWRNVWLIFICTMLVDLDHLLSTPIFDPDRLSVGHHLLHSYPAIGIYIIFLYFNKVRVISIGLLFHMFTDLIDYSWMYFLK